MGLMERNISYQIVGGLSFYQRKEIKDILSYLRILHSSFDRMSFLRVINLPKRGVGKKSVEKIVEESRVSGLSIIEVMRKVLGNEVMFTMTKGAKVGVENFLQFYDLMLGKMKEGISIADLIEQVYENSGYEGVLLKERETMQDRIENIDELISKADSYDKGGGSLEKFLEDVCLNVEGGGGRGS